MPTDICPAGEIKIPHYLIAMLVEEQYTREARLKRTTLEIKRVVEPHGIRSLSRAGLSERFLMSTFCTCGVRNCLRWKTRFPAEIKSHQTLIRLVLKRFVSAAAICDRLYTPLRDLVGLSRSAVGMPTMQEDRSGMFAILPRTQSSVL